LQSLIREGARIPSTPQLGSPGTIGSTIAGIETTGVTLSKTGGIGMHLAITVGLLSATGATGATGIKTCGLASISVGMSTNRHMHTGTYAISTIDFVRSSSAR
jgi:hypothetical protein